MRKYLIAGLAGLALIAGQAAAADSSNYAEREGVPTSGGWDSGDTLIAALFGGGAIALAAWGLSQHGDGGSPASP